ncbi:uncharacterized protein LOC143893624 [Temnothorax americanus]|uniref:uncharacterized protein LOC143893624 n=1 Tax=Temnothorax americanus TaxID=1964332 RepID=UPI0040697E49
MPSCCVLKCSNSSKKKYSMHCIPTDVKRRNIWVNNIGRSDLDPSKFSKYYVCEVHFAPEMWERQRVDGKKKLKSCAIPTIGLREKSTNIAHEILLMKRDPLSLNIDVKTEPAYKSDHDFLDNVLARDIEKIDSTTVNIAESFTELTRNIHNEEKENSVLIVSTTVSQEAIPVPLNMVDVKKVVEEPDGKIQKAMLEAKQAKLEAKQAKLKLQQASKIIDNLNKSNIRLMKRVKQLMYEKTKLIKEMCCLKHSQNFEKILSDDQIKTLCRPSVRGDRWSNDTIQKALKLRSSCGSSGYKEILNQGIPLPSERTLRRRIKLNTNEEEKR